MLPMVALRSICSRETSDQAIPLFLSSPLRYMFSFTSSSLNSQISAYFVIHCVVETNFFASISRFRFLDMGTFKDHMDLPKNRSRELPLKQQSFWVFVLICKYPPPSASDMQNRQPCASVKEVLQPMTELDLVSYLARCCRIP
ncbi:hypothetical protein IF1G_11428 [Cordyceps javanica]|uniref:Uncharacterized protein n=1 Tax=Cordyceps javanica TaxID=43265 RepID=A0A545UKB6_9HYPO|nr:hypothetical protein IF1G_11428 [Cordyceps javanica]